MECYYLVTSETDPYRNLALEEVLLRRAPPDRVLLYLWQNDNTVVIGRNQNAWRECRLEAFAAQHGHLARRMSGGGAVYHDLGNQNFSFIAARPLYDLDKQTEVVCRAVQRFGIDASRSGRNDILAAGRKFSGNAFQKTKTAALHHGTILISSELARLGQFLAPSPEKLAAKGVASVRARVINLCELNPAITPERMRTALLDSFAACYGVTPQPLPEQEIDQVLWAALTEHYASEAWRLGVQSAFEYRIHHRFSFGELELLMDVEKGRIQRARVYADIMDADWVHAFESGLLGTWFSVVHLSACVPESSMEPELRQQVADYIGRLSL